MPRKNDFDPNDVADQEVVDLFMDRDELTEILMTWAKIQVSPPYSQSADADLVRGLKALLARCEGELTAPHYDDEAFDGPWEAA